MIHSGVLTAVNGVPYLMPQGAVRDRYFFQRVSIQQGTGASVSVSIDYGFGYVDSRVVTTSEIFNTMGALSLKILSTGANCDFVVVSSGHLS